MGVKGEFLVATKFFQVSYNFSTIFIKFFKIPWYFQVFQVYSHFPGFPGRVGTLRTVDMDRSEEDFVTIWLVYCSIRTEPQVPHPSALD